MTPSALSTGVMQVALTLDPGGTERLVIEIAKQVQRVTRSSVCCLDAPGAWAGELTSIGIPVVALDRGHGFQPGIGRRLAEAARAAGARVIHCHQYSPFVYGRLATYWDRRLRLVYTEHGRLDDAPPTLKRRFVNPLLALGRGTYTTVSHDLATFVAASGFPASRLRTVHNGIHVPGEPTDAQRHEARRTLGLHPHDFVVGTIARLDPVKCLGTLLKAMDWLRRTRGGSRARVVIVGDGPEAANLQAQVAALDLSAYVLLAGHHAAARRLLPAFDVYVNSSLKEGISLSILEALAVGLPVVATAVGGTPEIIEDGQSGVLVPPDSPTAIADACAELEANLVERARLGKAGRTRVVSMFSEERMMQDYLDIYGELAGAPSR